MLLFQKYSSVCHIILSSYSRILFMNTKSRSYSIHKDWMCILSIVSILSCGKLLPLFIKGMSLSIPHIQSLSMGLFIGFLGRVCKAKMTNDLGRIIHGNPLDGSLVERRSLTKQFWIRFFSCQAYGFIYWPCRNSLFMFLGYCLVVASPFRQIMSPSSICHPRWVC